MKRPRILINSHFRPGKHNYYEIPERYFESVIENGGLPVLAPTNANESLLQEYVELADGFVFSGGDDYPPQLYGQSPHPKLIPAHSRRVENDLLLMKMALKSQKPILAICAGHQLLQIVSGGKLIQHLDAADKHTDEQYHSVKILKASILSELFGAEHIRVNSSHHQAIDPNTIPPQFKITAISDDDIIEAMENTGKQWILSLQWHPERIDDLTHRETIFSAFINICSIMKIPY
jgi:putative glutamine amidotransferase